MRDRIMRQCFLVLLFFVAAPGVAQSLAEDQGVELHGRITVAAYGYSECIVMETHHSESHYEEIKENHGERLHIYRVDLSVYNGSGRAVEYVLANANLDAADELACTTHEEGADFVPIMPVVFPISLQEYGVGKPAALLPGETVTKTEYVRVWIDDPAPRFANRRFSFGFVDSSGDSLASASRAPSVASGPAPPASPPVAPQTSAAQGLPSGVTDSNTCQQGTIQQQENGCWMEIRSQPTCYVWIDPPPRWNGVTPTPTWSGGCAAGFGEGDGTLRFEDSNLIRDFWVTSTGLLAGGKRVGDWVRNNSSHDTTSGPYVDGRRHGHFVTRIFDNPTSLSAVFEGPYVDGEQHGFWVYTYIRDGLVDRGQYVRGERHGTWVTQHPNGSVSEEVYVHGEVQ